MYKKQMKFQKIICYLTLIASAIVFIYSLGMMTDIYGNLYYMVPDPSDMTSEYVSGAHLFYDMQPFNKALTIVSLVLIILAVFLFIMNTHSRRRYYAGNYVSAGLMIVAGIGSSVWGVINVLNYKHLYLTTVDFEALEKYMGMFKREIVDSTMWLDISVVVFGLMIVSCVLLIVNLIWKNKVTKEEKALIAAGKEEK